MSPLSDLGVQPVAISVDRSTPFREAVEKLVETGLPELAVVDSEQRVVGFFGEDELLRGVFPRYLVELRHTAFTYDDVERLREHFVEISEEPVERFIREPIVIEADASVTHVTELLLHSEVKAVAIADSGRFVGLLTERELCRAVVRQWSAWAERGP